MPPPDTDPSVNGQREELRTRIRSLLATQRNGTVTVLSALLAVQDAMGYVPTEAMAEVAEATGSTANDVWGVASFYTNFRFTLPGEHVVEVCWGPSCHLTGAPALLKAVLATLGLDAEGETGDGGVTVKYNTCLGACAQAPVMSVDHMLMGKATPAMAEQCIRRLSQGQASPPAAGGS